MNSHFQARKALQEQRIAEAEFLLKMHHPEVFVSYRAAKSWALAQLNKHPDRYTGDDQYGWCVHAYKDPDGYCCSISQTWWAGDHCGQTRPTAALAIVQAMLELQVGY